MGADEARGVRVVDARGPHALARELAANLAATLDARLSRRMRGTLVVPGGRSPVTLFEVLSQVPLDWSQVDVGLSDERWVPLDDAASNEAMVRRHLAVGQAARVALASLRGHGDSPIEAAIFATRALPSAPVDAVVLGMGEDGHFASLFPDLPETATALALDGPRAVVVTRPATAPHPRLSLTLPALLNARAVHLLVVGDAKARVLDEAAGLDPANWPACPVAALLAQRRAPLTVWRCPG